MTRILSIALLTVAFTSSGIVCASEESTAHDDPLAALDAFVGSWIWEGTVNRHGEEPENFRWRFDSERILDGRFLLERQYNLAAGGTLVHLSIVGWCDQAKSIKGWGFWAPPSSPHEEVVYTKTADGWKITREGLDGTVTIIDDDTWKYEADFQTDGTQNHWGFTSRRLKSPTEADAKKAIDTLVGSWALTFEEEGETKTARVTATPSGCELTLRLTYQEPDQQPAHGIFAWDAANKRIVETWFRGGDHVKIHFDGMTDDGGLIGLGESFFDGKRFAGLRILTFHSSDHYTHAFRASISEGQPIPDVTIVATRIGGKGAKEAASARSSALLNEYAKLMVGEWECQATVPWSSASGTDAVPARASCSWTLDGAALEWNLTIGDGKGRALVYWDAASRELKEFVAGSDGSHAELRVTREGDKWVHDGALIRPDGTRVDIQMSTTFATDGDSHVNEYPTHKDVFRRVKR